MIVPGFQICELQNISSKGAKLALKSDENVPREFSLILRKDGAVRRKCRLVWQSGQSAGVRFV
jgi:hypothetical protein